MATNFLAGPANAGGAVTVTPTNVKHNSAAAKQPSRRSRGRPPLKARDRRLSDRDSVGTISRPSISPGDRRRLFRELVNRWPPPVCSGQPQPATTMFVGDRVRWSRRDIPAQVRYSAGRRLVRPSSPPAIHPREQDRLCKRRPVADLRRWYTGGLGVSLYEHPSDSKRAGRAHNRWWSHRPHGSQRGSTDRRR